MEGDRNNQSGIVCDRLLVGLAGSIGIHFFVNLLLAFKNSLAKEIRVIQTHSASKMLDTRLTGAMLDCDVWISPYDQVASVRIPHSELPEWADVFLVMPATANIMAEASHGHAGSLLSLAILASPIPVGFVPNMGLKMWEAPSTKRNVAQLREDGHLVLDQDTGREIGYALGTRSSMSAPDAADIWRFVSRVAIASNAKTTCKEVSS